MAKLVLLFSLSSLLAFYIMFSYPSCTIVCLLVCVLFCFLELNMWSLECVIFCNCFLDHFIVFFDEWVIFACFVLAGSCRCCVLVSCGLLPLCLYFTVPDACVCYVFAFSCLLSGVCAVLMCLWLILLRHSFGGFCLRLVYLRSCFAVSFTHLVSLLPLHDFNVLFELIAAPISHLFLPLIALGHNNYLCEHCVCFALPILCKTCPLRTFKTLFVSFSLFSRVFVPNCTHPYQLLPIHTHSWPFCTKSSQHHVRGNFSGHRS